MLNPIDRSTNSAEDTPVYDEKRASEAIRSWCTREQIDVTALSVDDLPPDMRTPEDRERIESLPAEDRRLVLFVLLAAAQMTAAEREAVGFTVPTKRPAMSSEEIRETVDNHLREHFPRAGWSA